MRRPRALPGGIPVQGPANLRLHETRIRPPRLQTDRRLRRGQCGDADRRAGLRAKRYVAGCGICRLMSQTSSGEIAEDWIGQRFKADGHQQRLVSVWRQVSRRVAGMLFFHAGRITRP